MTRPIYLDYMATTPVDPRVTEKMLSVMGLEGDFGNASSNYHAYGWQAKAQIQAATEQLAAAIGASNEEEIIWTSGATEANNLALKGAALANQRRGKHIITVATEHKSVLEPCYILEKQGFEVTYLKPLSTGLVDIAALQQALRADTVLVSVMWVNNETGVIQDIAAIAKLTREAGVLLHVDGVQAAGKLPINLATIPIDLLSLSAHKVYGPKGIGALYVRRQPRVRLQAQIHGGGQQYNLRSGTLPTHQILGMAEAFLIAQAEMNDEVQRIRKLSQQLWYGLSQLSQVFLNGEAEQRVPHNLNVYFHGAQGEALMMGMPQLAISSGSACNTMLTKSSYVLEAMGLNPIQAASSLRLSLGRFTTEADIKNTIEIFHHQVKRLRELSPLWEPEEVNGAI